MAEERPEWQEMPIGDIMEEIGPPTSFMGNPIWNPVGDPFWMYPESSIRELFTRFQISLDDFRSCLGLPDIKPDFAEADREMVGYREGIFRALRPSAVETAALYRHYQATCTTEKCSTKCYQKHMAEWCCSDMAFAQLITAANAYFDHKSAV